MSDTPTNVDEAIRVAIIPTRGARHVVDCSTNRALCGEITVTTHCTVDTHRDAAKLAASICTREDICADCREVFLDRLF